MKEQTFEVTALSVSVGMSDALVGAFDLTLLTPEQWDSLLLDLNHFMSERGLRFERQANGKLKAFSDRAYLVTVPKPTKIMGQALCQFMPTGQDAAIWVAHLTEIQMWLKAYPLNVEREEAGLPTLDFFWLRPKTRFFKFFV